MSLQENSTNGYICTPYLHDHDSVELKETWSHSQDINDMYFVTATFSNESKLYFPRCANHYLLAKFKDSKKMKKEFGKYNKERTSFVFNIGENFFDAQTFPSGAVVDAGVDVIVYHDHNGLGRPSGNCDIVNVQVRYVAAGLGPCLTAIGTAP